jgi:hypothetical protein
MRRDRTVRGCRLLLGGLAVAFAGVGALFVVAPEGTLAALDAVGARLGSFAPTPRSPLRFWVALATGYMGLVTALAWLARRHFPHRRDLLALLVLGKATSSLASLAFYHGATAAFPYLANGLVDGAIAVAAAVMWAIAGRRAGGDHAERTLAALVEATVPPGGPFPEGADAALAADVARFVAGREGVLPGPARAALAAVDAVSRLRHGRRFAHLALEQRVALLAGWERSSLAPVRQAVHLVKLIATLHFYSRPPVQRRLGYPDAVARTGPS